MREGRQKEVYLKKKKKRKKHKKSTFFKKERLIKKILFFPQCCVVFFRVCVCLPPESFQGNRVILLSSSGAPGKTDLMGIGPPGGACV